MVSIIIRLAPMVAVGLALWFMFNSSHDGFVSLVSGIGNLMSAIGGK